jgi:hypothetical protein
MKEVRNTYDILAGKPRQKKRVGGLTLRKEDNIKMKLKTGSEPYLR